MTALDLIAIGRVGVDLYPQQTGVSLARVRSFARSLGGSPTNVAVGAARLGARAAVVTKVGADPFGDYVRESLADFGVDARWVGTDPNLRTPIAFCEVHPPDDFPLLFYREPKAPDLNLEPSELDLPAIAAARVLWTTGTGLSSEPSRSTTLAALRARARAAGATIHDLDHRRRSGRTRRRRAAGRGRHSSTRRSRSATRTRSPSPSAPGTRWRRHGGCSSSASSWRS